MRSIRNYEGTYNVILSLCIIHNSNEESRNRTLIDILRWFLSIFPAACIVLRIQLQLTFSWGAPSPGL